MKKNKNLPLYFAIGLFFLLLLIGKFKEGVDLDINGNPIDCRKFKKMDVCNNRPGSGCGWTGGPGGYCKYKRNRVNPTSTSTTLTPEPVFQL